MIPDIGAAQVVTLAMGSAAEGSLVTAASAVRGSLAAVTRAAVAEAW